MVLRGAANVLVMAIQAITASRPLTLSIRHLQDLQRFQGLTDGAQSGQCRLPLHSGQVRKWLADLYDPTWCRDELSRCALFRTRYGVIAPFDYPFWFHRLTRSWGWTGIIDHHKRDRRPEAGSPPLERELDIHVCGGNGEYSRQMPHELLSIGERVGFDGAVFAKASRLEPRWIARFRWFPALLHCLLLPTMGTGQSFNRE